MKFYTKSLQSVKKIFAVSEHLSMTWQLHQA